MKTNIIIIWIAGLLLALYLAPAHYITLCIILFAGMIIHLYLNARKEEREEVACLCIEVAEELFDIEEWEAWVESAADELRTVQFEEDRARVQAKGTERSFSDFGTDGKITPAVAPNNFWG